MINENIQEYKNNNWKSILIVLLINAAFLVLSVFIFKPQYCVNDDNAIIMIVSGAFGQPDAHMIYSNYLLGLILSSLYKLVSLLPWYALLYYVLMLISFSTISCVIVRRSNGNFGKLLILFLVLCGSYECYVHPTFTKTASILGIAGVIQVLDTISKERISKIGMSLGLGLIFFGFLIRDQQLLAVGAVAFGAVIIAVHDYIAKHNMQEIYQRIKSAFVWILILVAALGAAKLVDYYAYSSEDWQYYRQYDHIRSQLTDYGWPSYESNEDLYESLNISREDLEVYQNWDFYDTEKLPLEAMEQLVAAKGEKAIDIDFIITYCYDMVLLLKYWVVYLSVIPFLIFLISRKMEKADLAVFLYLLIVIMGLFAYLIYMDRWNLPRVNFGIFYASAIVIAYMISDKGLHISALNAVIVVTAGILLTVSVDAESMFHTYFGNDYENRLSTQALISEINADSNHVYISDVLTVSLFDSYYVFDTIPQGTEINIMYLGGWSTNIPLRNEILDKNKIVNPYRSIIENDKIYFIDYGNLDLIVRYLKRNYDQSVEAVQIKATDAYNVYKISIDSK